jgi:TolB protein
LPLLLAAVPIAVFAVAFGASVAYFRITDGTVARSAGADQAPRPSGNAPGVATGGGRLLVALRTGDGVYGYLASVRVDGSELRSVTKPQTGDIKVAVAAPAVSPDGRLVAFHRAVAAPDRPVPPFVYIIGMDGSGLRRLTEGRETEIEPAWSPDGTKIAFAREVDGAFDLFVWSASGLTRLTDTAADELGPAWSPDGTRIAFARYDQGVDTGSADLWIASADGTAEMPILESNRDESTPAWSPDGKRIAYLQDGGVAIVNADGTAPRSLTEGGGLREGRPAWSPDGSRLAFTRDPGELFILTVRGSTLSKVPLDLPATDVAWELAG